jgi:hypothetical protein
VLAAMGLCCPLSEVIDQCDERRAPFRRTEQGQQRV